ncbi:MAG: PQQ-binding-like beta-propeller repeat protein [Phycisphaeraceae bacterium]
MLKRALSFCLVLALVLSAGCTSPKQSEVRRRQQDATLAGQIQQLGYNLFWAADLGVPRGGDVGVVQLLGDLVIVTERPANIITALRVEDGSIAWRQILADRPEIIIGAVRVEGEIYINSENAIYTLDARTGRQLTYSALAQSVTAPPSLYYSTAMFGGIDGLVFAHDLTPGFAKWRYQLSAMIPTSPVVYANTVFVADRNGVVAMLDIVGGELLWKRQPTDGLAGAPVVTPTGVLVPTIDNKLYFLNRATGKDAWPLPFRDAAGLPAGPVALGSVAYQPVGNYDAWVALSLVTGEVAWRLEQPGIRNVMRVGDNLLMPADDRIFVVDPQTGKLLKDVPLLPLDTVLPGPDNSLILVTPQGRLLRINPLP